MEIVAAVLWIAGSIVSVRYVVGGSVGAKLSPLWYLVAFVAGPIFMIGAILKWLFSAKV
ncbi:MAG TPA: hypothetical protein VFA20_27230 [Myxococcaceae bacterium]|nr:hypothetical protein [Myxococcaceae bacterium]